MADPPLPVFEKIVITLEWNKVLGYKMRSQKNEDPEIVILQIEPNAHLATLWESFVGASQKHFEEVLGVIGTGLLEI